MVWLAPDEPRVKKSYAVILNQSDCDCFVFSLWSCTPWMDANTCDDHSQCQYYDHASSLWPCMKEKARTAGKQLMDLSPQRCTSASVVHCKPVFAKNQMTGLSHPPHSSDLASCDFFLFDKLTDYATNSFWWCGGGESRIGTLYERNTRKWLEKVLLCELEKTNAPLHCIGNILKGTQLFYLNVE